MKTFQAVAIVIFIAQYIAIFCITILAMIHIEPFYRMDVRFVSVLFSAFIIETVAIGIEMMRKVTRTLSVEIQQYDVKVQYRDYFENMKGALTENDANLYNDLVSGKLDRKLLEDEHRVIAQILAARINSNNFANGKMVLTVDGEKGAFQGTFNLKFVGVNHLTPISVTGRKFGQDIELDLSQPARNFWIGERMFIRPPSSYSIHFIYDKNRKVYLGTLYDTASQPGNYEVAILELRQG